MKSTRKWIAAIMAVLMLVLMAACGNGGNAANENKAGYRTLEPNFSDTYLRISSSVN